MAWRDLKQFHYWCQKVLPLVYDESLSYYEVLAKTIDYLNDVINDVNELHEITESGIVERIDALEANFSRLSQTVNSSLLNLNERCSRIEAEADETKAYLINYIDSINTGMQSQLSTMRTQLNMLETWVNTLNSTTMSTNSETLRKSKAYTDAEILKLKRQLGSGITWYVVDPMDGQVKNIQTVINQFYDAIRGAAFTCWEFDRLGYTCEYLDSIGYTASDFDWYGRFAFLFDKDYVTQEDIADFVKRTELEHYALKTDLDPYALKSDLVVYNPTNGLQTTIQNAINVLISFHACGNNCITLDGLDYTASDYDGIGFTAYEFDFNGIVKTCGLYTSPVDGVRKPLQSILNDLAGLYQIGLSASQFDAMDADADTLDGLEYTAWEFDFIGLNFFADNGLITVITGISAEEYQNLVKDEHGFLRVFEFS